MFHGSEPARRVRTLRLELECLEDRTVPAAIDLTTRGAIFESNGAIFRQCDAQPTGTGFIKSFLRIDSPGASTVEQGYNSDARPVQFDEDKNAVVNHALNADAAPSINIGGRYYREFLLDINQTGGKSLLSLDELRIFIGTAPDLHGYDVITKQLSGLTAVYDLDANGDTHVKLDYGLNPGSGAGDMLFYLPDSLIDPLGGTQFIYVYSKFGVTHAANAGFEEWAVSETPITVVSGSISGVKFHDQDGDGIRDAGESLLAGWTIFFDANDNGVLDSDEAFTVTDAHGAYSFDDLAVGLGNFSTYRVREVQQDGWQQTTADPADIILTLEKRTITGIDFGNIFEGGGGES